LPFAWSAETGPISVVDSSGDVKVEAQNGPVTVKLAEGAWSGPGLDARTDNGPLSLRVPSGYGSGVEVTMSSHVPYQCGGGACEGARDDWDSGTHTVALGGSHVAVRLSTVNGPVSIKRRG
jgi:hypothetical protein